jgi:hypothetical protein
MSCAKGDRMFSLIVELLSLGHELTVESTNHAFSVAGDSRDLEGVASAVYNNMQVTIRSHEFLMIEDEGWISWELQTGKVDSSEMSERIMKAVKRAAA